MKNTDPRLTPILTVAEAAAIVGIPTVTLYDWLRPRKTREPLISGVTAPGRRGWPTLSVIGLAEAHTAHVLRDNYWTMPSLIKYVSQERKHNQFPLAVPRLVTDGIDAFIEHDDQMSDLSRLWDHQIPFSDIVRPFLRELVPWDDDVTGAYRPTQLDPDLQLVEIDPRFNGGRISFARNRVPLYAVVGAMSAGESAQDVAEDYRLTPDEVALVERHRDWLESTAA